MSELDDPALVFIKSDTTQLQDGGPSVDQFQLGLYCMRELPVRRHRVVRSLVSHFRNWHEAWLENNLALHASENADLIRKEIVSLKSRLEANNSLLPTPSSTQLECIEAIAKSQKQSVPEIVSELNQGIAEVGGEPMPLIAIVLELQQLSVAGYIEEVVIDTIPTQGTRRTSAHSIGYKLREPAGELFCSACRQLLGGKKIDCKNFLEFDDLTLALGIPRQSLTAFLRLIRT